MPRFSSTGAARIMTMGQGLLGVLRNWERDWETAAMKEAKEGGGSGRALAGRTGHGTSRANTKDPVEYSCSTYPTVQTDFVNKGLKLECKLYQDEVPKLTGERLEDKCVNAFEAEAAGESSF